MDLRLARAVLYRLVATRSDVPATYTRVLLHNRARRLAAVNHQVRRSAVRRLVAGEEERRVRDFAHCPNAAEHDVLCLRRSSV